MLYEGMYHMEKAYSNVMCQEQLQVQPVDRVCEVVLPLTSSARTAVAMDLSGQDSADDDVTSLAIDEEETVEHSDHSDGAMPTTRSRKTEDPEKMSRRAIANSNERRRMQSINAGFQQLKELVRPGETEKLSKAAILQHAVEFIGRLKNEKQRLSNENERLVRMFGVGQLPAVVDDVTFASHRPAVTHNDHRPQFKRIRLHDESASYSSSSSSISSVSSDEGVAELSSSTGGPGDRLIMAASMMPADEQVHVLPQLTTDKTEKKSAVDGEPTARRRRKCDRDLAESEALECRSKVVPCELGSSANTVVDKLTNYGVAWDYQSSSSGAMTTLKLEPSKHGVFVKQESIEMMPEVPRFAVDHRVVATGDAVVPTAVDDKIKMKSYDQMFACAVDHKWPTVNDVDDIGGGPEVHAVRRSISARGGCRSPSPGFLPTPGSMSQRNLETIIEAIRFLEGDMLCNNRQSKFNDVRLPAMGIKQR